MQLPTTQNLLQNRNSVAVAEMIKTTAVTWHLTLSASNSLTLSANSLSCRRCWASSALRSATSRASHSQAGGRGCAGNPLQVQRAGGGGRGQVSPTHKLEPSGKNSQTHKKNKDTINGPLSFLLLCVRYCCQGGSYFCIFARLARRGLIFGRLPFLECY